MANNTSLPKVIWEEGRVAAKVACLTTIENKTIPVTSGNTV